MPGHSGWETMKELLPAARADASMGALLALTLAPSFTKIGVTMLNRLDFDECGGVARVTWIGRVCGAVC
jgi:hypothetical protein